MARLVRYLASAFTVLTAFSWGCLDNLVSAQEECIPVPVGLVSWWPGDGNADDMWDANDASLIGYTGFASGKVSQGFSLPGSTYTEFSRVEAPDAPNLRLSGPFTLDAWIEFSDVQPQTGGIMNAPIVGRWGDTTRGTAGYRIFVKADGKPGLEVSSGGTSKVSAISSNSLPVDEFAHVAGVWDGDALLLYVNGVLEAVTSFSGPLHVPNGIPLLIGGYNPDFTNGPDSVVGIVDEVEIFSRALSVSEIQAIHESGSMGKCVPEPIEVDIDIKPRSCPNPLNTKRRGVLPVAILGTPDFDASEIDGSSILLEGVPPIRDSVRDVNAPVTDEQDDCDCTTEGPDGFDDLTLKFWTQEIVAAIGPVNDGDELVLTLTGNLLDGTPIEGQDCVLILKKGK